MQRFFRTVSIVLLCGILSCPVMEGRGRNNGNNGGNSTHTSTTHSSGNRQTQATRPSRTGNNSSQPGNRPGGSSQGNRPGGSSQGNRPNGGSQGNQGNRPNGGSNQGNQGNRPNGGGNQGNHGNRPNGGGNQGNHGQQPGNNGYQPGHNGGGNHGQQPGHQPGHQPGNNGYGHGPQPGYGHVHYGAPNRPMMPPPAPYCRPTPPPRYNPWRGPSISTILGLAIGTSIDYALNNLLFNGYDVLGYGNNIIYVGNVNQLNMLWPDARLHYGAYGDLIGSDFVYSTPYYDMNRYNTAYSMLVGSYGMPVSTVSLGGGGWLSTWWGPGGQYITLQFSGANAVNGALRYYTTLSFGN